MANLWDDPAARDVRARLMDLIASRPDDMRDIQPQVGMA